VITAESGKSCSMAEVACALVWGTFLVYTCMNECASGVPLFVVNICLADKFTKGFVSVPAN
jgi:hypothetical protein